MKSPRPTFDITENYESALPDKAILWPTESHFGNLPNGDSTRFPDWNELTARLKAEIPRPLQTFGHAVSQARRRVLIIDAYLFDPLKERGNSHQHRVMEILCWLPEDRFSATDVRILTGSLNSKENEDYVRRELTEHAEEINSRKSKGSPHCVIEVNFNLGRHFGHVHDRFAIIDDELWHFGATVGGFHHQVSAASRGWRADDHRAVQFFDLAWAANPILGKSKK